ncbi:transposase, partial [Aeromonas caviae]
MFVLGDLFAPSLDKARYRRRNVVERCFGWLKKFRRFS